MKNFVCTHDGSLEVFIQVKGTQTGLYCAECGKWIKWLSKDEIKLAERQIADILNNKQTLEQPKPNFNGALQEICNEVSDYLKNNFDPYTTVIITDSQIRVVQDIEGIQVKRCER